MTCFTLHRWHQQQAHPSSINLPRLVVCNDNPRRAGKQLKKWPAHLFDPVPIDQELGCAARIGLNAMRVFLHDLARKQDAERILRRVDDLLSLARRRGIGTLLTFFGRCWQPFPRVKTHPKSEQGACVFCEVSHRSTPRSPTSRPWSSDSRTTLAPSSGTSATSLTTMTGRLVVHATPATRLSWSQLPAAGFESKS